MQRAATAPRCECGTPISLGTGPDTPTARRPNADSRRGLQQASVPGLADVYEYTHSQRRPRGKRGGRGLGAL
ncbi:hypothetical protein AcV7_008442 [Taiwanofungus camphoratus]|nr:hypothetical protein AcV7_008442 [Antrodia cinnamomea]